MHNCDKTTLSLRIKSHKGWVLWFDYITKRDSKLLGHPRSHYITITPARHHHLDESPAKESKSSQNMTCRFRKHLHQYTIHILFLDGSVLSRTEDPRGIFPLLKIYSKHVLYYNIRTIQTIFTEYLTLKHNNPNWNPRYKSDRIWSQTLYTFNRVYDQKVSLLKYHYI